MKIKKIQIKLYLIVFSTILIISFASLGILRSVYLSMITERLDSLSERISQDIQLDGNLINIDKYNSDPLTPLPNQSGLFPLYIITVDGLVIERSQIIDNFLDTSNFNYWESFSDIRTITTQTNENWRIIARPITKDGVKLGIVVVSYHLSISQNNNNEIDLILNTELDNLIKSISINNDELSVSGIDIRNMHYMTSFEVVDRYNKVLLNNGRTPAFIDPSYIQNELKSGSILSVNDVYNNTYLLKKITKFDESGNPMLLIVVGEKISDIDTLINKYFWIILLINLIVSTVTTIVIQRFVIGSSKIKKRVEKLIKFNAQNNKLIINQNMIEISNPSNQYNLCICLFSNPNKKWTLNELLDKLGEKEDELSHRKYYDTVIALNKKINIKLFEYKNHQFSFNKQYIELIK